MTRFVKIDKNLEVRVTRTNLLGTDVYTYCVWVPQDCDPLETKYSTITFGEDGKLYGKMGTERGAAPESLLIYHTIQHAFPHLMQMSYPEKQFDSTFCEYTCTEKNPLPA